MKVVVATGGSGGHFFPALKLAAALKCNGHTVCFIGTFKKAFFDQHLKKFEHYHVPNQGFRRDNLWNFLTSLGMMARAFCVCWGILRRVKPDAIIGFGGYASFPVVLVGIFMRRKTLIHEQNVMPGKANKWLAPWVNRIAISFSQTRAYFERQSAKVVLTGCPCHETVKGASSRVELLNRFSLYEQCPVVLVAGGSQGSQAINDAFLNALPGILEHNVIQVIHICGAHQVRLVKERYECLGVSAAVYDFCDQMAQVYQVADVVVARAGAVTVAELAMFEIPSVLIPYPHADGHQCLNAQVLQDAGVATVIEQAALSFASLSEALVVILNKTVESQVRITAFESLRHPKAVEHLIQLIENGV